jgi:hypothetical protein
MDRRKQETGVGGKEKTRNHNVATTKVSQHKISITFRRRTYKNDGVKTMLIKNVNIVRGMRLHRARWESSGLPCGRRN